MIRRRPGKAYKQLKRTPFQRKPSRLKPLGKQGKKWAKDRKTKCKPEWLGIGVTWCVFRYSQCWRSFDGFAHSLKRMNRTRPEHDWETAPACNPCHDILERMGIEGMANEVRRIRTEHGLPIYP